MKPVVLTLLLTLLCASFAASQPAPTNLQANHDGDGSVTLTWSGGNVAGSWTELIDYPQTAADRRAWTHPDAADLRRQWAEMNATADELDDFITYRVYRDGAMIGVTTSTTFQNTLPTPGSYTYTVTSLWDEGESAPSNEALVVWYDPEGYLLQEDFDDGLPDTWTVEGHTPTMSWHVDFGDERNLFPTPYMLVDSDSPGSCPHLQERLILPSLDFSNSPYGEISFSHIFQEYAEEHGYIQVRVDGGNWVTAADFSEDLEQDNIVDITQWAADEDDVEISFYYDDLDNWGWYWAVDDVEVYSAGSIYPVILILTPTQTSIPPGGGAVVMDVEIENTLPQTFTGTSFWTTVVLPNGNSVGPLLNVPFGVLPYMEFYYVGLAQPVPAGAPAGTYTFRAHLGYPGGFALTDEFPFTKTGAAIDGAAGLDLEDWRMTAPAGFAPDAAVATQDTPLPDRFALGAAYPNPFNAGTSLTVQLPETGRLTVAVYDITGREVMTLVDGPMAAGSHRLAVQAGGLASGVYFVRAQLAGHAAAVQKVALVK